PRPPLSPYTTLFRSRPYQAIYSSQALTGLQGFWRGSPRWTRPSGLDLRREHASHLLEVLEHLARTEDNAFKRVFGDRDRQTGTLAQHNVKIAQQCATPGQDDPLVDDIGGKFGRHGFKRRLHRIDDLLNRLRQ